MTIEMLRKVHEQRPFRPFTLHIADGRQLPVPHSECLWVPPSGRTIFVESEPDAPDIVDVLMVTTIKLKSSRRNGQPMRKRAT